MLVTNKDVIKMLNDGELTISESEGDNRIRKVVLYNPLDYIIEKNRYKDSLGDTLQFKTIPLLKKEESYTFKGELNVDHLINDCIKNNQQSFVAFTKSLCILSFSRQISTKNIKFIEFTKKVPGDILPLANHAFHIFILHLTNSNRAVTFAKSIPSLIKKEIKKTRQQVRKTQAQLKKQNITQKKKNPKSKWVQSEKVKVLVY